MGKQQGMVYVVDDDASVRKALMRLLRSVNLHGEAFSSAEEFLSHPRQLQDACILIDLRMPGLTGYDLQQKLVSHGIEIPVIVISASDDQNSRHNAKELGAIGFFRKPVDDQALLDAIWWALAKGGTDN